MVFQFNKQIKCLFTSIAFIGSKMQSPNVS